MARPKYIPTDKELRRAWIWKKKGYQVNDICTKLKITRGQYDLNKKAFNSYFTRKKKELTNDILLSKNSVQIPIRRKPTKQSTSDTSSTSHTSNNKGKRKVAYKDINLQELEAYVLCGFDRDKIANLIGVSRKTLLNYSNEYPPIKDILDNARHRASSDVVANLLKMCGDKEIDDTYFASYLGEITSKRYKKVIPANLGAVRYWMANAHNWADQGKPERQNSKGLILESLDAAMNGDDDEV